MDLMSFMFGAVAGASVGVILLAIVKVNKDD